MSVVISRNLTLGDVASGGGIITANNPVIGYANLLTAGNVAATSAAPGFPASNLANPSTNLRWVDATGSPAADQYITVAVNSADQLDYLAVARHNFGSAQIPASVEGLIDPEASPAVWIELVGETLLADDQPALFRFAPQALASIRLRLQPGSAAPTAAVIYTGKLLVLQRQIYVGHTPINFGRSSKITNARSENGQFLGRIILSQMTATKVDLQNLTPNWYRSALQPFIDASREAPFFFAWRPASYPGEIGYAWMTNDPQPSNQRGNGMMQISLEMGGIYL